MLKNLFSGKDHRDKTVLELEKISAAFKTAFSSDEIKWQWDERFNSVLAEFDAKQQEKVLALLSGHFTDYWYNTCIGEAPGAIQQVNERLGGLKPGQLFFSTDATEASFLYCAWWPWNLGKTISIRISLEDKIDSADERYMLEKNCKDWFSIQPNDEWDKFSFKD